jgi:hypothetical protein
MHAAERARGPAGRRRRQRAERVQWWGRGWVRPCRCVALRARTGYPPAAARLLWSLTLLRAWETALVWCTASLVQKLRVASPVGTCRCVRLPFSYYAWSVVARDHRIRQASEQEKWRGAHLLVCAGMQRSKSPPWLINNITKSQLTGNYEEIINYDQQPL